MTSNVLDLPSADAEKTILHPEIYHRVFVLPEFDCKEARKSILDNMPDMESYLAKKNEIPKNTESFMDPCYAEPLLTRDQEFHLFRKYNCLKHLAIKAQMKGQAKKSLKFDQEAAVIRNLIGCANFRLVPNQLRKFNTFPDYQDLLAEGYRVVLRAVDYFDFRKEVDRGDGPKRLKFCTYAVWCLQKNIVWKAGGNREKQLPIEIDEGDFFVAESDNEAEQNEAIAVAIQKIFDILQPNEREVLRKRMERYTLEQIGRQMQVSKERVRQLEDRAHRKVRQRYPDISSLF